MNIENFDNTIKHMDRQNQIAQTANSNKIEVENHAHISI